MTSFADAWNDEDVDIADSVERRARQHRGLAAALLEDGEAGAAIAHALLALEARLEHIAENTRYIG